MPGCRDGAWLGTFHRIIHPGPESKLAPAGSTRTAAPLIHQGELIDKIMNRDVIAINLDLLPSRPRHILQPAERGRLRCLRGSPASAPARILDAIGKSLPAKAMVMLNLADTLLPGLKRHHDLDLLSALLHGTADMCGELVRQAPTQLPQPEAVLVIQETDLLIGYSFPLPAILWSPQAMFMAIVVCIPHEPSRGVNLPLLRDQFTVIDVVESNGDNH